MTTKISGDNISAIANQGVTWNAVTVADGSTQLNASAGNGYLLDTNTGVIEVFLPTSPTRGDTVIFSDYAGTFATNNVIVNTGGVAIDSTVGSDFILSTNNRIAEFVYIDSNKGWLYKGATTKGSTPSQAGLPQYDNDPDYVLATGGTITTSGDYKIHTFTGDGCFVVSPGGNQYGSDTVDYLVVAGGGSGGGRYAAGGGGGGYRESHSTCNSGCYTASPLATPTGVTVSTTTYPVTVGAGGVGSATPGKGTNGSNSVFSTITSTGGGAGGTESPCGSSLGDGNPGGSGGGARYGCRTSGSGNTPPVSPPQGNNGGDSISGSPYAGGGGGGATEAGVNGVPGTSGRGGQGATTSISTSPSSYAGGGGAGATANGASKGLASPCGTGGAGAINGGSACAGAVNTGGGGGGFFGGPNPVGSGANGGKGIVIIRYKYQ